MTTIGLIADTHGLLRPEARDALAGSDHIIHAGDVGDPAILLELGRLAPLIAIRGNIDTGAWADALGPDAVLETNGLSVYVLHDRNTIDLDPVAAGFGVVVSGHSHRPGYEWRDGVLYINPGSAGPRRFSLPVTVGRLIVSETGIVPAIIPLIGAPTPPR